MAEKGIGSQHFILKYFMDSKSYNIRDLGNGSGTFIKIDRPLVMLQSKLTLYYSNWDMDILYLSEIRI